MQSTAKVRLAILSKRVVPNPHILSCVIFEIQMSDKLEVTLEEKNILWCIFPCQTGVMAKPLRIYWLGGAVSVR